MARFADRGLPCSIVRTPEEALRARQFSDGGRLRERVGRDGRDIGALPLPLADSLKAAADTKPWPRLGEHNDLIPEKGGESLSLTDRD